MLVVSLLVAVTIAYALGAHVWLVHGASLPETFLVVAIAGPIALLATSLALAYLRGFLCRPKLGWRTQKQA